MKIFNILLLILLLSSCGRQTDVLYNDATINVITVEGTPIAFDCTMVSIEQNQVICYIKR